MRVMVILIVINWLGTVPKGLERELEEFEIRGRIETIQTIALLRLAKILIGQNTEESPEDLKILDVTQTPVKDHQSRPVWKIRLE